MRRDARPRRRAAATLAPLGVLLLTLLGLLGLLPAPGARAQTAGAVRVNAGGPAYTDTHGQVWDASSGFSAVGGTYATTNAKY